MGQFNAPTPATGKSRETATQGTAEKTSRAIANSAVTAGRAVGKTGVRIARPLVESVKHEDNKTLAKMLMAAVTPQLVNAALRIAVRKPLWTAVGVLVLVTAIGAQKDES